MRLRYWIIALAVAGTVSLLDRDEASVAATPPPPPPPAAVAVASVERIDVADTRWLPASVGSRDDAAIASENDGVLVAVAEPGARVARGEVIARLDAAAFANALARERAEAGRLEAQLALAERNAARLRGLAGRNTVAASQVDIADAEATALAHALAAQRAVLAEATRRHAATEVRAPFAGVVVERRAAAGERVAAGSVLLRLVDTERLVVRANAPVALAPRLAAGAEVTVRDADGTGHSATLAAVVPVGDASSRQIELRVHVDGGRWPVGSALELGVAPGGARAALVVPRDALVLRDDGAAVFRVGSDGRAERVAVTTGVVADDRIEVVGALAAGDRVVVRGAERLAAGQAVAVLADPVLAAR